MYGQQQDESTGRRALGVQATTAAAATDSSKPSLVDSILAYINEHPVATLVAASGYFLWWTGKGPK